ncbi:ATP-binding protein [Haloarchaeobius sp. TZWWS8]|uniref:ATP-binding protein n=1 Tax=Haloarchaeobius sp. TZWWS8 TaxID=3446121 RepID=UPI003EBD2F31
MGSREASAVQQYIDRSVGVAVLNDEGRYVFANGAYAQRLGYDDPAILLDTEWQETLPRKTHGVFREGLSSMERTGRWFGRIARPDGVGREVSRLSLVKTTNGETIVVLKRGQEPLSHEERLAALSEASRDLFAADDESVIAQTTVNVAECVLDQSFVSVWLRDGDSGPLHGVAGTDGARVIDGAESLDLRPIHPNTFEMNVFENDERVLVDNFEETPDRSHPDLPISTTLFVPLGTHGLLATGIPHAGQLADSTVELLTILGRNAGAALEQAAQRRALRERNERLDEFTSIVSHDLRSPLSVVVACSEHVTETGELEYLDDIRDAAMRMERLIDELLTLSKQGADIGEKTEVSLHRVARAAWSTIDSGEATLEVTTDRTVLADRERLRTALENLFRNAIEHGTPERDSETGDVTERSSQSHQQSAAEAIANGGSNAQANDIDRRGDDGSLTITVGANDDAFFVADDGPGIPPEHRSEVFERGFTTNRDGTGFGLAIVRRIAVAHGWKLRLEESDAGGAKFSFGGAFEDEGPK